MPTQLTSLSMHSLSVLDWCLLLFIFLSTIGALRRGLIRVLFSIAGLGAGILIASWNYLRLAGWLSQWIANRSLAQGVAFVLLLFAVIILASVLAGVFRRSASAVGLGFFDRLFGAVFGLLRGIILATVAVVALVAFVPNTNLLQDSQLAGYLLQASHRIAFVVPEHLQEQLAAGTAHLLQQSPKPFRPEP